MELRYVIGEFATLVLQYREWDKYLEEVNINGNIEYLQGWSEWIDVPIVNED